MVTTLVRIAYKMADFLLLLPLFLMWSFVLFLAGNGTQTYRMR